MKKIFLPLFFLSLLTLKPLLASEALERLDEALKHGLFSYETLSNYKATFVKQESEEGSLGEREEIYMKFEKPWKIYMEWLNTDKKGLQIAYERGRHDNKLAIHKPGLMLGLMPVVFLDQNSPWVKEGSASYNIEDAGIGTFMTDFSKAVEKAKEEKRLKVEWLEGRVAEVTFLNTQKDEIFFAYRIRTLFDPQSGLPIHMELFDWQNEPMGIYSYEDLTIDVEDKDPEFQKRSYPKLYKIYKNLE